MQIKDIQCNLHRIPLPVVLSDATHGEMPDFELITVRIRTASGLEGVGYTYTVGAGGKAIQTLINHDIRPVLLGADARGIESLWQAMWHRLHWVGRGGIVVFAISAVDVALWDLNARLHNQPLWRLLGGKTNRVQAYAGGVDLYHPIDQLVDQTRKHIAGGFRAIKMKVGRPHLREDLERVQAVRELVGPDVVLMVDANMQWRVDQAIRAARALKQFDVLWLEEPITPDDVAGHLRVSREGGLPIAAGENLHTVYEFQSYMSHGCLDFPEPDLSNVGGITAWMRVAKMAQAHNLPVTSHGVHDLHVHLLAAAPNGIYLEVHGFGLERFVAHPLKIENGEAVAPDRPGHGVEFNWQALAEHEVQPYTFVAKPR
jgi:L-alanine-DL-glutamate epimerase-like enolase superfamily enzyme